MKKTSLKINEENECVQRNKIERARAMEHATMKINSSPYYQLDV